MGFCCRLPVFPCMEFFLQSAGSMNIAAVNQGTAGSADFFLLKIGWWHMFTELPAFTWMYACMYVCVGMCLTLLDILEIYLIFSYWKSRNSTGILPGFPKISWCCGVCCDWYDATMDVDAIFPTTSWVKIAWTV